VKSLQPPPLGYSSYQDLVRDPDIEIVYVANTHNGHLDAVLLALNEGKHVLCEKPLAVNAKQAELMVQTARENKLFLMEAMWTRFLPAILKVREWLSEDIIGTVKQIQASFGMDLKHVRRLTDPQLAGGALLDLGIYPLSFASMVMHGEKPASIYSRVEMLDTGVDGSSCMLFQYSDGTWADLKCSCLYRLPNEAWIIGDKGRIHLPADFYAAQTVSLMMDGEIRKENFPSEKQQTFKYQMQEVQDCVNKGNIESSIMPLNESINLARTMDQLRDGWGVKYPCE
jgi:predicted dehydrogenase